MKISSEKSHKTSSNRTSRGSFGRRAAAVGFAAILLLPGAALHAAQSREVKPAKPLPAVVPASQPQDLPLMPMATNGVTARIQADLETVKGKIDSAVKSLQDAAASSQVQRASSVSNVAAQIRTLATSDLGDTSTLVKETDKLIAKMRAQIGQGRTLAADPREEAREAYAQGLLTLEPELARLIDRRTSVARVRSELLRQAGALESRARAIAWLEDADQMRVASKALEEALTEALAFAGRIDELINQLGKGQPIALE